MLWNVALWKWIEPTRKCNIVTNQVPVLEQSKRSTGLKTPLKILYEAKPVLNVYFLIQILIIAIAVSLLHRKRSNWFHNLSVTEPVTELLKLKDQTIEDVMVSKYQQSHFERVKSCKHVLIAWNWKRTLDE